MTLIAPSYALSMVDSTVYPIFTLVGDSTTLITITKEQQENAARNYEKKRLLLEQCDSTRKLQKLLILELESKLDLYKEMEIKSDSIQSSSSIIIQSKDKEIQNLEAQLKYQKDITEITARERKKNKRQLLGWKIGTFTVIGIFAIALPTTIAIMAR